MTEPDETVNVRYMVDDVDTAIEFYTERLGFEVRTSAVPAFADVIRGNLRLLLSGPASSAGRPMPDGARPSPGGWNRIHLIVADIATEVARLRDAGVSFRNDIVTGPAAARSCSKTPRATSSSSSNPPAPETRVAGLPMPDAHRHLHVPQPPGKRDPSSARIHRTGRVSPAWTRMPPPWSTSRRCSMSRGRPVFTGSGFRSRGARRSAWRPRDGSADRARGGGRPACGTSSTDRAGSRSCPPGSTPRVPVA